MGLFWDLIQQDQISRQRQHAATLEGRVADLERESAQLHALVHTLLQRLETHFGEDIDGDGGIG